MNILEVTQKKAQLNLSRDEMNILNNSLMEVINILPDYGFETRIDLSREEIITLQSKISKLLKNSSLKIRTEFNRQEMLGIKNSLNEICYGITIHNFETKIGASEQVVKALLESFLETTKVMFSEEISFKIGYRAIKYSKSINPFLVKIPRSSPTRRECNILVGEYQISCLLFSFKNSKTFSGIQILIMKQNDLKSILFKTIVQKINISDLIQIIAYFDEYMNIVENHYRINEYVLSILNYDHCHIFNIQALSGNITSKQEGFLDLSFKINLSKKENIDNYFTIQAPVSFDNIYNFTSAIREYLVEAVAIANAK